MPDTTKPAEIAWTVSKYPTKCGCGKRLDIGARIGKPRNKSHERGQRYYFQFWQCAECAEKTAALGDYCFAKTL